MRNFHFIIELYELMMMVVVVVVFVEGGIVSIRIEHSVMRWLRKMPGLKRRLLHRRR